VSARAKVRRVRNGEEYLSLRTARKRWYCEVANGTCAKVIEPGDRYVFCELPPNSDHENVRWWRIPVCVPCGSMSLVADQLFGSALVDSRVGTR
jgi:hypothetical protein